MSRGQAMCGREHQQELAVSPYLAWFPSPGGQHRRVAFDNSESKCPHTVTEHMSIHKSQGTGWTPWERKEVWNLSLPWGQATSNGLWGSIYPTSGSIADMESRSGLSVSLWPLEPAAASIPEGTFSARGGKKEVRLLCMSTQGLASLFVLVYGDSKSCPCFRSVCSP